MAHWLGGVLSHYGKKGLDCNLMVAWDLSMWSSQVLPLPNEFLPTVQRHVSLISVFKLADSNFLSLLYLTDHNFKATQVF